jgi:hypothetical protein
MSYLGSVFHSRINHLGFVCGSFSGETRRRVLSIGDGILLAASCRTQTVGIPADSNGYKLPEGNMRDPPNSESAEVNCHLR